MGAGYTFPPAPEGALLYPTPDAAKTASGSISYERTYLKAIHVAQVGAWLVAAKKKCQHGEWLDWLEVNCPEITRMTANKYERTYLKAIEDPNVNRNLQTWTPNQAYRMLGIVKDPTKLEPVENPPLPEGIYNVIYADPPWQYDNTIRSWGPAELHYPTMSLEDICNYTDKTGTDCKGEGG